MFRNQQRLQLQHRQSLCQEQMLLLLLTEGSQLLLVDLVLLLLLPSQLLVVKRALLLVLPSQLRRSQLLASQLLEQPPLLIPRQRIGLPRIRDLEHLDLRN